MTLQHPHAELSAYIDGALAPAAQAAVEGHVAACAVCRAHIAQLRATVAFVRALPDPVPSRRLVPRLAAGPAWLAPLRTVMTLASGTAVFLFIASALVSNLTFLASSGTTAMSAPEAARDRAASAPGPQAGGQPASSGAPAPATTPSVLQAAPSTAFAVSPTASASLGDARSPQSGTTTDDAQKRFDQSTAAPTGAPGAAAAVAESARPALADVQRSPLLNPWLWLALALACAAIAVALHRRLHSSV